MANRRTKRGLRRPTEDAALGRISQDEKRAARARRRQAWAEKQRHGPSPPLEGTIGSNERGKA